MREAFGHRAEDTGAAAGPASTAGGSGRRRGAASGVSRGRPRSAGGLRRRRRLPSTGGSVVGVGATGRPSASASSTASACLDRAELVETWMPRSRQRVGLEGDRLGHERRPARPRARRRSISRRTSSSGGASDAARLAAGVALRQVAPVRNDSSRLPRGRATSERARRIASASRAVTPGRFGSDRGRADQLRRRTTGTSRPPRRAGRRNTTGSGCSGRSSARTCAHCGPPCRHAILPRSAYGRLLPLDRGRRLAADVVDDAVDARDLVHDPRR